MTDQPPPNGLLLSDDLMFTSRITATARSLDLRIATARSMELLLNLAKNQTPACVIVDLANPGLAIVGLIDGLRESCSPMPRVVAYGSHVDVATLQAARAAGCDIVLPRSKFVEELPVQLPAWLKSAAQSS